MSRTVLRNRTSPTVLGLLLSLGYAGAAAAGGGAPKETGLWYDDTGKGAVRVELCGNKLCGKIYWLKDLVNAEGKPLIDRHNPNEAERTRPICGLQVVGGLANMPEGGWDSGWIYDPKDGKSYSVAMELADADTLKVTGYLVMKMMGRTLTWKRAPADLPACATQATQAPNTQAPSGAAGGNAAKVGAASAAPAAKAAAKPSTAAAGAQPKAAAKPTAAGGEDLPWRDNKKAPAGAKPAAEASKLGAPARGASNVGAAKPGTQKVGAPKAAASTAPKKAIPADVTPQHLDDAAVR